MNNRALMLAGCAAIAVMVLAGCTPTGPAAPTASLSPSEEPEPGGDAAATPSPPTPPAEAVDIELPACSDLLDLSVVQANFGASAEFIGDLPPEELTGIVAGPVAEAALAEAAQKHGCIWGIPQSDGGFTVVVAELPAASRDTLTAALGSSAFTGSLIGTSPAYTWEREEQVGIFTTIYAFASPLWIIVSGTGTAGSQTPIAGDIIDHLRAQFPGLGD